MKIRTDDLLHPVFDTRETWKEGKAMSDAERLTVCDNAESVVRAYRQKALGPEAEMHCDFFLALARELRACIAEKRKAGAVALRKVAEIVQRNWQGSDQIARQIRCMAEQMEKDNE